MNPALLAKLIQLLPTIVGVLPELIELFKQLSKKDMPSQPVTPTLPPTFEEEDMIDIKRPTPPTNPLPIFSSSQLNVMDVDGKAWFPGMGAIGWGSYIRLDSNPKDEQGKPLPASELAQIEKVEWKSLWDGEPDHAGFCHINVGGKLFKESNGLSVSAKIPREGIDNRRHTLDFWLTYHLKGGRTVDTNEVRFEVD